MVKFIDLVTPALLRRGYSVVETNAVVTQDQYNQLVAELQQLQLQQARPSIWFALRTVVVDGIRKCLPDAPQIWTQRTQFEKWTICVGGIVILWKLGENGRICRWTMSAVKSVVPGARWLMQKFSKPKLVVYGSGYVAESVREGSEENNYTVPKSQCGIVFVDTAGNHVLHGNAVRFPHDYLVAPDHVLTDDGNKWAKGKQGTVDLKDKERVQLDADLVAIKLTEQEFSRIGLSTPSIGCVPSRTALAKVVNYGGKGTTAQLRQNPKIFGMLIYEGTTQKGYSGAAYTGGSYVQGVHAHGGRLNGGYAASYIMALLNMHDKRRPEDTPDYLKQLWEEGHNLRLKKYGLDEYMVVDEDTGRYDVFERVDLERAFGKDFEDGEYVKRKTPRQKKRDRGYDDGNPDEDWRHYGEASAPITPMVQNTGESNNSRTSGASRLEAKPRDSDELNLQDLTKEFGKLSRAQRRDFRRSLIALKSPGPGTPGQVVPSGQPAI